MEEKKKKVLKGIFFVGLVGCWLCWLFLIKIKMETKNEHIPHHDLASLITYDL